MQEICRDYARKYAKYITKCKNMRNMQKDVQKICKITSYARNVQETCKKHAKYARNMLNTCK